MPTFYSTFPMENEKSTNERSRHEEVAEKIARKVLNYYRSRKEAMNEANEVRKPLPMSLEIMVRPLHSRLCFRTNVPFRVFQSHENNGFQIVFEDVRALLEKAEKSFGKKHLVIEINTDKNEKIVGIVHECSKKVAQVIRQKPQPQAKSEPKLQSKPVQPKLSTKAETQPPTRTIREIEPKTEEKPAVQPKPVSAPVQPVALPPTREKPRNNIKTSKIEPVDTTFDPSEPIDYETMKYFSTQIAHRYVRDAFVIMGIKTGNDILELLGTNEPTRTEWEIFIRKIRNALKGSAGQFGEGSDSTLYWWLTSRVKWVKKFPSPR